MFRAVPALTPPQPKSPWLLLTFQIIDGKLFFFFAPVEGGMMRLNGTVSGSFTSLAGASNICVCCVATLPDESTVQTHISEFQH